LANAVAAAIAVLAVQPAAAQSPVVAEIQVHLYAGHTADAAAAAERRLAVAPDDDEAHFALGAVRFIGAVENLSQSLYRYGLRGGEYGSTLGLIGLPILRIPVPHNPDPDELTYAGLREVLAAFVDDLAAAEATLAMVGPGQIDLPLDIGSIRLDIDGDGDGSAEEALWQIFAAVSGARGSDGDAPPELVVDFDQSDVPWLQAYCHLLSAIADFPLAYDWEEAFDVTFPGIFPMPSSPNARLHAAAAEMDRLFAEAMALPEQDQPRFLEERGERFAQLRQVAEIAGIADLIAFIHLNHWPLVDADRMRSIPGHLRQMTLLSRDNWARILAETDDGAEWIPNPGQTGAFPEFAINQEQIDGWQDFLDEFDAILLGQTLIPHWRFEEGINMARLFSEPPKTFDIVLLIEGAAALPYLEPGEVTSERTWRRITQVFGGDFFRFFLWLN
jgi:hypothetical protein